MARDRTLERFIFICQKPTLYVQCARFTVISAYIAGYDDALEGGALVGFREWLLTGTKLWTNLPWWSLVRLRLNAETELAVAPSADEETALIAKLKEALEGFLGAYKEGGLPTILHDYNSWLLGLSDPAMKTVQDRLRTGHLPQR